MINCPYIFNGSAWTFFIDGKPFTLSNTNPLVEKIIEMISSSEDMTDAIRDKLKHMPVYSEKNDIFLKNFGNFTFKNVRNDKEKISVTYKNFQLPDCLADRVLTLYKEGCTDYSHFEEFVKNILANPNEESVKSLYSFLEKCNLPITDSGEFIAYKGVRKNYYSVNGNKDSRILRGKVDSEGHILNEIGSIIEMVASDVDKCRESACSTGLHVGSFNYANEFGERVIAVLVNPKDVIAVPYDSSEKCRVSKYHVICDIDKEILEPDVKVEDNTLKNIKKNANESLKRKLKKVNDVKSFNYYSPKFRKAIDNNIENHSVLIGEKSGANAFISNSDYVLNNPNYNWIHKATTIHQLKGSVCRQHDINYSTLYYYLVCLNYKLTVNSKALGKTIVQI